MLLCTCIYIVLLWAILLMIHVTVDVHYTYYVMHTPIIVIHTRIQFNVHVHVRHLKLVASSLSQVFKHFSVQY